MPAPFVWYDLTTAPDTADRVASFYRDLLDWPIGPGEDDGPLPRLDHGRR